MSKKFILVHDIARQRAIEAVREAPAGMEVVVREPQKVRSVEANAAMWAGILADITTQVFINGRRFSAEAWHEHCKREFLPEVNDPELTELVKDPETYRKWDYTPSGDRICIGSTTRLTKRGFARYTMQIEAMGAELGVVFSAPPNMEVA